LTLVVRPPIEFLTDGGESNPTAPFALQQQFTQVISLFNLRTTNRLRRWL